MASYNTVITNEGAALLASVIARFGHCEPGHAYLLGDALLDDRL